MHQQPLRLNSFGEESWTRCIVRNGGSSASAAGSLWASGGEHAPFLPAGVAPFPLPQQLAHLGQHGLRIPQQMLRAGWGLGPAADEEPRPTMPRYPGLLREMLPQEQQYEQRDPAEMPPPQSRLLQYRQQIQPRSPGDLPSPSSSAPNHSFPAPTQPSYPDTSREPPVGFSQAPFPPDHSAGQLPVKYLLQEAHWPHPGHMLGHGLPFGMQAMAQRQDPGRCSTSSRNSSSRPRRAPCTA
ncbi:probable helicase with zinc finger domain [Danio aesculapii]|uniref:probable helicase with zinc finger domain n=1 Tax=Danio aesculapii TaxID=1142201 RepID=UPI0024C0674D|nr:probable helicase with zinc finger domain [Danio aesculapii]